MTEPLILSTWSFGKKANAAGWPYLTGPSASSLDAVEQACRTVEADPEVLSVGRGGCPDRSGEVSLDASIMLSPARCGSVCYVRRFAHPVTIARLVMEKLRHMLVAGDGADRFAMRLGLTPANLLTDSARAMWQKWATNHPVSQYLDDTVYFPPANQEECYAIAAENTLPVGENLPHNQYHDTVGVLAMDARGQMAGACSTSGLPFKIPGRVGDSPIIGHGLYVDPKRGAAVTTGMGELVMSVCGSFLAVDLMGRGAAPLAAAREVLDRIVENRQIRDEHQVAIITLDPAGRWSSASLRPGYHTAVRTPSRDELADPEFVVMP
jgi:N4-(beta-N-acetylglucosaminyl)-L-asparaginase